MLKSQGSAFKTILKSCVLCSLVTSCFSPSIRNLRPLSTLPAARFGFSGGNTNFVQGGCTGAITVSRYDSANELTYPPTVTTISFAGMATGSFYLGPSCAGAAVTSATIPASSATVIVSFRNPAVGTEALSMSSTGLTGSDLSVVTTTLLGTRADYTNGSAGESWIHSGDINRDGIIDIVTTNSPDASMIVFLGLGNGTFGAGTATATLAAPRAPLVTDLNGDGWDDILVSHFSSNNFRVFYNNQVGGWNTFDYLCTDTQGHTSAAGDFDGDGNKDVALVFAGTANVKVFWGDGTTTAGNFSVVNTFALPGGGTPLRIVTGDFDNDGDSDLLAANLGANNIGYLRNDGARAFTIQTAISYGAVQCSDVSFGDMNGDGKLDIAVSFRATAQVAINLGNGDGSFQAATVLLATSSTPNGVQLVDLNNDGILDIVNASTTATPGTHAWFGVGDGTFVTPRNSFATLGQSMQLTISDFNSDGAKDIAVTSATGTNQMGVWINNF